MKILAISTWFPFPPDNGSKIRTYNLLKYLGERHTLDLISLTQSPRDLNYLTDVRRFCRRIETFAEHPFDPGQVDSWLDFLSPVPRYFRRHFCPELSQLTAQRVQEERYDAVLAVTLGAAPYAADLNVPFTLLDEHNIESQVLKRQCMNERSSLRRLRFTPTWLKAQHFESSIARKFSAVTVVSETERLLMEKLLPNGKKTAIQVVPNGIDPDLLEYRGPLKQEGLFIFTGALTYRPNYDASVELSEKILPHLRNLIANARIRITGKLSNADVGRFGGIAGVELTGYVDDIRAEVASAAALLVPIRQGGGTRLKILEAMALGTPVVSTPMAAEGLGAVPGVHIVLAESSAEFAEAAAHISYDEELAGDLARNAREFVAERYQWPAIAEKFESIISRDRRDVQVESS